MPEEKNKGRPTNEQKEKDLLACLQSYWDIGGQYYPKDFKKIKVLDATDRGDLWKATGIKFPPYQILPDTNNVTYIKSNLLASIYSVVKSASILPTSEEDKDLCENLNVALDCLWDVMKVGLYQFQAGERAALCNLGITQVGWDENLAVGAGESILKGNVRFKNIDPLKFMRDPFATEFKYAGWCCTYDNYHKSVFENNSNYKEAFKEYIEAHKNGDTIASLQLGPDNISVSSAKDYYTLVCYWVRDGDKINEYHTINNKVILYKKENIKPSAFPFALLYCNLPAGALVGTSEPAKVFANNIVYNLMDSIACTAEYKNQQPPKFISDQSKLNVQAFAEHGDEANKTFVVSGDATKAVHYHQFPQVSNFLSTLKMSLAMDIQNVSGVDQKYTGRDTGSIITTGGTEQMLSRVTLIDAPKIVLYEDYCRTLTELVLGNMIEFCPKRKFFRKKPNSTQYETTEVDFPKINAETLFNYRISISSELPKNKQRIAAMATELLKSQAQYRENGGSVNWITEEEWLMFQDLPMKEYMLERMGVQRQENALEEVAQVLYGYSQLLDQGATPDQAMQGMAEVLRQTRQGQLPPMAAGPNPELQAMANTASGGPGEAIM